MIHEPEDLMNNSQKPAMYRSVSIFLVVDGKDPLAVSFKRPCGFFCARVRVRGDFYV